MLSLAAAVSAPLRTRSQNVSTGNLVGGSSQWWRGACPPYPRPFRIRKNPAFRRCLKQAARPKTTTEAPASTATLLRPVRKRHVNSLSTSTNGPRTDGARLYVKDVIPVTVECQ